MPSADAAIAAEQKQRLLQEAQIAAAASLKATNTEAKRQASRATFRAKAKASNQKSPSKRSTAPTAQTRGRKRVESVGK